ncbi:MAG: hypothetical protein ACE5JP_04080 [Candidatus Bipolaricaulia bacterium]
MTAKKPTGCVWLGLGLGVSLLVISTVVFAAGVTDPDVVLTPAPLPLQPRGVPFTDPVFETTLIHLTDDSDRGGLGTHIYSQLQAFSFDNVYVLLIEGSGYVVRRMSNLSLVQGLDTSGWNAPRWHPGRSHTIIHFDSNDDTVVRVQFTDVDTLTTTTVFTFPAQYERVFNNQSFDEISLDGRWMAGAVQRNDGAMILFALDISDETLGAVLPVSDLYAGPCQPDPVWGEIEPDWVGVSPLGRYLVVQWQRDGTTRCSGLETFDIQTGAFVGRVYDGHQHGDLGVLPDGVAEYFMTTALASPEDNNLPAIVLHRLPGTNTVSPLQLVRTILWGDASHISCRGPAGVCVVTSSPTGGTFDAEVYLQYVNGSVLRLVHHRSSECGYWVQPRASISRDGHYVIFASDWGQEMGTDSCGGGNDLGRGEAYIIQLSDEEISPPEPEPAPEPAEVYFYPNPVTADRGFVHLDLDEPGNVTIHVYSVGGNLVRRLAENRLHSPGDPDIAWNTRDDRGRWVANEVYLILVQLEDGNGNLQTETINAVVMR